MKYDMIRHNLEELRRFLGDRRVKKTMIMALCGILALILLSELKGLGPGKQYIRDGDGNLIGLHRDQGEETASYPLFLEVRKGKRGWSRKVVLTLQGKADAADAAEEDPEEDLQRQITAMIGDIGDTTEEQVILPKKMEGGYRLRWEQDRDHSAFLLLLLLPLLLVLQYEDRKKKEKEARKKEQESVLSGLPAFNNQLLILLNCGLIFRDAFARIAHGYALRQDEDYFRKNIIEAERRARDEKTGLVHILNETAKEMDQRSFTRMVSVISENQYRGIDLTGKLSSESQSLWDQRKKLAEEKGKLAETRLAFPLAILLLVLIMITAAPALLQVKGV